MKKGDFSLKTSLLVIVILCVCAAGFFVATAHHQRNKQVDMNAGPASSESVDILDLWSQVNSEREKIGAKPLRLDPILTKSAQAKCNDMVARDYYEHDDPDGRTWQHFVVDAGYDTTARHDGDENLAAGEKTASGVVGGWMSSPPHRKALLDSTYINEGFGVCYSEDYTHQGPSLIFVQHLAD